jgi:hypothetical protein
MLVTRVYHSACACWHVPPVLHCISQAALLQWHRLSLCCVVEPSIVTSHVLTQQDMRQDDRLGKHNVFAFMWVFDSNSHVVIC